MNTKLFYIDDCEITADNDITLAEACYAYDVAKSQCPKDSKLTDMVITITNDGRLEVNTTYQGEKFQRIRRITGYLTGDLITWNNAKRAEESERVKHL